MASFSSAYTAEAEILKECPFDKNHKVAQRRYRDHVLHCPAQYGSDMITCPYNSLHKIPKSELTQHLSDCVFREQMRKQQEAGPTNVPEPTNDKSSEQPALNPRGYSVMTRFGNKVYSSYDYRLKRSLPSLDDDWEDELKEDDKETRGSSKDSRGRTEVAAGDRKEYADWRKMCFHSNGNLIKPLQTIGVMRLSNEERSEYYEMLRKAASINSGRQTVTGFGRGKPVTATETVMTKEKFFPSTDDDDWGL